MMAEAAHRAPAPLRGAGTGGRYSGGDLLEGPVEGGVIAAEGIAYEEGSPWRERPKGVNPLERTRVLHHDLAEIVQVKHEDGVRRGRELG